MKNKKEPFHGRHYECDECLFRERPILIVGARQFSTDLLANYIQCNKPAPTSTVKRLTDIPPPDAQAPDKSEKSKPKEQQNVFCADRSTPERFLMVDQVNCETVCNEAYREYRCDLNKLLAEGWKVTGVSSGEMTVSRPPCECKITGTETTMEK